MGRKRKRKKQPVVEPTRSKRNFWIFASVLILAITLSYSPAWTGGLVWDNDAYILRLELRTLV